MHSAQNMPTWQIFPDTDKNYRWVSSGTEPVNRSEEPSTSAIHGENPNFCLPSMTDLLFQGSAKLLHSSGKNDESCPMFRTGLGKSVPVKQSSILKALSVLGGDDGFEKDARWAQAKANLQWLREGDVDPRVKESFSRYAYHVIWDPTGLLVLPSTPAIDGSSKLLHSSGRSDESSLMFRTGLGKSVPVKQSSILKALSVLGGDDGIDKGQVHTGDGRHSLSNSLFQTGSGKMVNISSAGLIKAQTLLGLEENSNKFMADEIDGCENSLHAELCVRGHHNGAVDTRSIPRRFSVDQTDKYTLGSETKKSRIQNLQGSEMCSSTGKPPPVKFQTAGGRSISVSNDALQRAKSLLGDLELGVLPNDKGVEAPLFSFSNDRSNIFDGTLLNKENDPNRSCFHQDPTKNNYTSTGFPPPKGPFTKQKQFSASLKDSYSGGNLHQKFDTIGLVREGVHRANSTISCKQKSTSSESHTPYILAKDMSTRINPMERSSGGPLVDISNHISTASADQKQINCEKRRFGRRSSVSPFKRPRISRFSNPLETSISFLSNGSSMKSEDSCCKAKVSARYPFQTERMTLKKYFGDPPHHRNLSEIPEKVRCMNAASAEMYLFDDASGLNGIGIEAFHHMLAKCGVSMHNASKEWVSNHYKWIVWKLACYERWYTDKGNGKYLTVPNVLEELKYRYEREVNHSHRSALKRILEGDASPASMMVLCISAIQLNQELETEPVMVPCEDAVKSNNFAKMELTDGWYSVNAILDVPLSNLLVAGKLFVGQKLRIWRASLCGWVGPVSPLEASKTVSLLLHMNGTYRAHWADRLGFCKKLGAPLSFRCIKGDGGLVPRTLVGVTRVYPILYKERLSDGGSIVRSERMETKACQLYNERRSTIAEGIVSEFQMEISSSHRKADSDSEEGAKIFRILERAAEPDVIMAGMSTDQLKLFATYQAKQEAIRQSDMQKKIEKALEDAGLSERQVSPFMRLRVVGLNNKHAQRKGYPGEGLITIWNPTDEQQCELVEGQAYIVAGLIPLNSDSATIYLQARGSTTTWQSLHPLAVSSFEPFFAPRKSILLSNLGEVPLASEFDIAAVVVYVGDTYISGHQKKQWMFVTDDSMSGSELLSEGSPNCLLAISFCSPIGDANPFAPINHTLAGSTVGFFNLVKRARDQTNDLWVAEATDNSTYSSCYDLPTSSHLKEAATSAYKWAKIASLTIEKLRQRALFIIGDGES